MLSSTRKALLFLGRLNLMKNSSQSALYGSRWAALKNVTIARGSIVENRSNTLPIIGLRMVQCFIDIKNQQTITPHLRYMLPVWGECTNSPFNFAQEVMRSSSRLPQGLGQIGDLCCGIIDFLLQCPHVNQELLSLQTRQKLITTAFHGQSMW